MGLNKITMPTDAKIGLIDGTITSTHRDGYWPVDEKLVDEYFADLKKDGVENQTLYYEIKNSQINYRG
jgi:hypothetical protein